MFVHCPPLKLAELESVTQPDGKRYYVTPSGKKLPSVTTVVGAMKKKAIMEWRNRVGEVEANRVSKLATGRGNRVHLLAEKYLNNEPIQWSKEMPDAVEMFRTLIKPIHNINNIQYQEQALWSEKIDMAGRVDLIADWCGVPSVIDFKTSKKIKKKEDIQDYFAQCTAYALMYEELVGTPIDQLVIVMAVENEQPLIFVERTEDHINNLLEHINFYKNQK
jgi:CRISPR/Cas system-associated exonuclease Cas4 (RecB family)